ncbi:MAG: hypothetical protein K8L99_00015 [Anaerolineae bacterium]|nr:hypothetical protein [Anaerolineae bacterium]
MVREGINAYRAGNKNEARALLFKAVELDERHEQAWLWLSAVVDSLDDQQTCLENVLTVNPSNERARQGLRILEQRRGGSNMPVTSPEIGSSTPAPDIEEEDPFASISFTDPLPEEPATFTPEPPPVEEEEEDLNAPVDWATIETSSASALRPTNELTPDDYDDWVTGLNLKSGAEEDLNDNPFSSPSLLDETARDAFGFEEDTSEATFDEESPFGVAETDFGDDEPFGAEIDFEERLAASPPLAVNNPVSMMSPSGTTDDPLLDDIVAEEDEEFDFDEDFDDLAIDSIDPEEYFKSIPNEIRATRLPGSVERYPVLIILGLLLFVAINIGALALVIMTLTTV